MEKLIACCGLDCTTCEARIATMNNDDKLRAETAEKWKVQHNVAGITPDMINCTGCREEGVKIKHCQECQIRNCVSEKGYKTCGDCDDLETCSLVKNVHQFVPEALTNLKNLN